MACQNQMLMRPTLAGAISQHYGLQGSRQADLGIGCTGMGDSNAVSKGHGLWANATGLMEQNG